MAFEEITIPFLTSCCWFGKRWSAAVDGRLLRIWEAPLELLGHWPLAKLSSRGQFFCMELNLKLCLSVECWCSSLITHVYVTSAFHRVPSFILFSWSHIWVFPTFIFNMDLLQNLLIFKRDIIKSWKSPRLRTPALLLSCWCYLSKATWCLTAASVMVRARGSGAGYNSGVIWLWDLVWVI